MTQLTDSLFIYHGNVNVGILRAGERCLLIDCGNGHVVTALESLGIQHIDRLLFTHHHRDSASGVTTLRAPETRIGVPAQEQACFAEVERYWADPARRWHLYDYHPHNLMLATSVRVDNGYVGGDSFTWGSATITVLDTPGHTDGSISYLVEVDGRRILFCGDTIYGEGQIWELYSLQKGEETRDYHGFLGARKELNASLVTLVAQNADLLVPTHGRIISEPKRAVDMLRQRLAMCYDRYVAISALRHYFPKLFAEFAGHPGHMPIRVGKEAPGFLRHIGTTWLIISATGEAFVMDCGTSGILKQIQRLQTRGEFSAVTELWITHYHDDHVDALPEFQVAYPCATRACGVVADIVRRPLAYRLPCLSPAAARIDHVTQEGESWMWNEFRMTAWHFPGQTYYHGGLLVEGYGLRLFFAGDSFTMAGIDDYCAGNRNLLGRGVGYDRCLALVEELQPTHIFNCHVDCAFDFTTGEIARMRANLAERAQLFGDLFPWDHANYGMDEQWVRTLPYEQDALWGDTIQIDVIVTNHSDSPRRVMCRPILPAAWGYAVTERSALIPPRADGTVSFTLTIPQLTIDAPLRIVIPIDVIYDETPLGQFREALLTIHPRRNQREDRQN